MNQDLMGFDNIQERRLSNILLDNFISFYDWGFLNKGGFVNVNRPTSGLYGGNKHLLKPTSNPDYQANQVWQAHRKNWVWETGISKTTQPNAISGIYVNNSFLPYSYNPTSGYYVGSGYRLDHLNGTVIFNSPISATSVVSLNYSYKYVFVYKAEGFPFARQVQRGSFRLDQNFFTASGSWVQFGETRVQLPAVLVEAPNKREYRPYQLGGGQWADTDITYYILSDNMSTCINLQDAISYQNDRVLRLYNPNTASKSGDLPFNYRNDLVGRDKSYSNLLENHNYNSCFVYNTEMTDPRELSPQFYMGTVKHKTEVSLANLT